MWQLTEDRKIREQIRRREANINNYNQKEKMLADLKEQVKERDEQLKSRDKQLRFPAQKQVPCFPVPAGGVSIDDLAGS